MASDRPSETGADTPTSTDGSCLCGSVHFTISGALRPVWQCHCRRCQKATGNFMAATGALAADIAVEQFDALRWYHPDEDPNVAYAFCRACGSSLFWRIVDQGGQPDFWSICAGSLDNAVDLSTDAVWFSDHAAPHTFLDPTAEHLPSQHLAARPHPSTPLPARPHPSTPLPAAER